MNVLYQLGRPLPATVKALVSGGWARPRGETIHRAIDIPIPTGTQVIAVADGEVIRYKPTDTDNAGIWIGLRHAGGVVSRSMHFSRIAPGVVLGTKVRKGQVIGYSGNTGRSSGPHLHFDLKVPQAMLAEVERAVGRPVTGYPSFQDPYGWAIASEPWVPVDAYAPRTIAEAAAAGVPLYRRRAQGGMAPVLVGAAAAAALLLAR